MEAEELDFLFRLLTSAKFLHISSGGKDLSGSHVVDQ